MRTAVSYQALLQGTEVPFHLSQQQLQLATRHVELLLGLVAVLDLLLRLEMRPQGLQGCLLSLPALKLLPQILQATIKKTPKQSAVVMLRPGWKENIQQRVMKPAYSQRVLVVLQSTDWCVWVTNVHSVASALCMGQPQQQRVEALMELLKGW